MKILIATPLFPPDVGGPATYAKILVDELPKRGHVPRLVIFSDVKHLPKGIRHFVYFWRVFVAALRSDIILALDPVSVGYPAAWAAMFSGRKFVVKVVGDYAWEQGFQRFGVTDLLDDFLNKKYGGKVERLRGIQIRVAQRSAHIITPSEYLKEVVVRWGIDPAKISVVYNAVSFPETFYSREVAQKELGLDPYKIVLISAGRLVPWKGFGVLISAVAELSAKYPNLRLFIIGEGPEQESLKLQVANYPSTSSESRANSRDKLQNKIILLGPLPQNRLLVYLRAADAFVLNTGYEGLSHQIIEAMVMGIPVISTLAGGNEELLRDYKNAIIAGYNNKEEWKSAIEKLIEERFNMVIYSAALSAEALKKFGKERMISQTIFVFQSLLK